MTRLLSPRIQVEGADGRPLAGAKLYTYVSGTNTPKPTYTDVALSVEHTNPVIADAAGRFPAIFLTTGDYKTELRDANEVVIATDDPVDGAPAVETLATLDNAEPVVYNGRFDIWHNGTSIAIPASSTAIPAIYTADGWSMVTGASQACTVSRQPGITSDSQFCMRVQRDSGQTGTGALLMQQWIETSLLTQLRGKAVVFAADLRVGGTFSGTLQQVLYVGTGPEGRRVSAYAGETTPINSAPLGVTTSTQRFSQTSAVTIPVDATQAAIVFRWTPSGTAGANDFYEVGRVVLAPAPGIDPPITTFSYELTRTQRPVNEGFIRSGAATDYRFAVPANATRIRLEFENISGAVAGTLFLRISTDNGATYKTGSSDYVVVSNVTSGAANTPSTSTANLAGITPSHLSGQPAFGWVEMDPSAIATGLGQTQAVATGPALPNTVFSFSAGTAAGGLRVTNILLGIGGTTIATGTARLVVRV